RTGSIQLGIINQAELGGSTQDNLVGTTLLRGQGNGDVPDIIPGCPRVDQFITCMGESRFDVVRKRAANIVPGQMLLDKISGTWNRVRSVEILKDRPIWGVAANGTNGKLVCGYS